MIRSPGWLCLLLAAATPAPPPVADVESLLAAERAFAASSAEHGMRTAFLQYLARGAVIFRPGPVDARKWFEEHPEDPGTLDWSPSVVSVAGSDDLGYTSGPWVYRPPAGSGGTGPSGHFVSVWRRQDDGAWKVVFDLGVIHAPEPPREEVEILPSAHAAAHRRGARRELLDADRALTEAAGRSGAVAAYMGIADEDVRLYRDGHAPVRERSRLGELVSAEVKRWEPEGGGLSRDGSLGYTYGTAFRDRNGAPDPVASYLRIWRRDATGAWKLVVDAANLLRPAGE